MTSVVREFPLGESHGLSSCFQCCNISVLTIGDRITQTGCEVIGQVTERARKREREREGGREKSSCATAFSQLSIYSHLKTCVFVWWWENCGILCAYEQSIIWKEGEECRWQMKGREELDKILLCGFTSTLLCRFWPARQAGFQCSRQHNNLNAFKCVLK